MVDAGYKEKGGGYRERLCVCSASQSHTQVTTLCHFCFGNLQIISRSNNWSGCLCRKVTISTDENDLKTVTWPDWIRNLRRGPYPPPPKCLTFARVSVVTDVGPSLSPSLTPLDSFFSSFRGSNKCENRWNLDLFSLRRKQEGTIRATRGEALVMVSFLHPSFLIPHLSTTMSGESTR